ncbi:MAG: LysM peptidoglycan-binding domain-containing protein [Sporolactobacillus sp.]
MNLLRHKCHELHLTALIVLFLLAAIVFFSITNNVIAYYADNYQVIQVQSGDNLWKIAEKYHAQANHISINQFIKWVEERNGIDGSQIMPNQRLIIPVTEAK